MRILIAGAGGMLGADLVRAMSPANDLCALGRDRLDITDNARCREIVREFGPDIVICAAAMTDVDGCETQADRAFRVNADGAGHLAEAAALAGACIVHYSTDYVFDGTRLEPYRESDPTNPISVYGKSKLMGELRVRNACAEHLLLRTSWLFGSNGRNFIRTIAGAAREGRELRVVHDQRGSPTYTSDLARYTRTMLEAGCRGTYHLTNRGSCSWYELACRVVEWIVPGGVPVTPVSTADYPRPAARPANSVLANDRLKHEGLPLMRGWEEAAEQYVCAHLLHRPFRTGEAEP